MNKYAVWGVLALGFVTVAPSAVAQKWEFGGGLGGSFYLSRDITNNGQSVGAKLTNDVASSVWLGNNASGKWGGEIRYDYQRGDYSLSRGSTTENFGGDTHALHYDVLWHATTRESPIRPFLLAGAGIKVYRGTGAGVLSRPLDQYALFTNGKELKPLLSIGAGVKWQIAQSLQLRLEVHDYITPFPKEIVTPNAGSNVSGVLQNIVPMLAISYTF